MTSPQIPDDAYNSEVGQHLRNDGMHARMMLPLSILASAVCSVLVLAVILS